VISQIMEEPERGRPGDAFFEVHETLGVALLVILVLHWLWSMARNGRVPFGQLFPWPFPSRYAPLWRDVKRHGAELTRLRLPKTDEPSPMASAVHGLGLTVATVMGATGLAILIGAPEHGAPPAAWFHDVEEVHEAFATLMWIYLIGHAAVAALHQLAGHGTIAPMLRFWRRQPEA
jgi:cytochrome b561